jgi:hypothetical protein
MKTSKTMFLAIAFVAILATTVEVQAGEANDLRVVEILQHGNEMHPSTARGYPMIRLSEVLPQCGDDLLWVPEGSAQSNIVSLAMTALIHDRPVDVAYQDVDAPWGPWHCRLDRLDVN